MSILRFFEQFEHEETELRELFRRLSDHFNHCDPVVAQHQGIPHFKHGVHPMSQAFTLPFDSIATVALFALRAGGSKTNVLPGTTITSDNPAIDVALVTDTNGVITGYTATATVVPNAANPPLVVNITLNPPPGASFAPDVSQVTLADDPVVSQAQDTPNATFAPNPNPPTAPAP